MDNLESFAPRPNEQLFANVTVRKLLQFHRSVKLATDFAIGWVTKSD